MTSFNSTLWSTKLAPSPTMRGPFKISLTKMLSFSHLPIPKVDLTKWGLANISPTKNLSFSDSPTPNVDLTKWGLAKISPTKMLSFSDSPSPKTT